MKQSTDWTLVPVACSYSEHTVNLSAQGVQMKSCVVPMSARNCQRTLTKQRSSFWCAFQQINFKLREIQAEYLRCNHAVVGSWVEAQRDSVPTCVCHRSDKGQNDVNLPFTDQLTIWEGEQLSGVQLNRPLVSDSS